MIRLENVHKALGGRPVLDGLTLDIEDGGTMVVIGRSGCGKSVTLKHIVGLMRPDAGRVYIDGDDITGFGRRQYVELRKQFGFLFQSSALLGWLNVYENIALPLREHTHLAEPEITRRVAEKLEVVGLEDAARVMPADLSGGMKKRVALARAIVLNPKIILYDEPTTGLDPIMANKINELINDMEAHLKVTSVVVTHDLHSAYMIGDRIAMLHDGRIVESGTPDEIRNSDSPVVRQFVEGKTTGPLGPH